MSYLRHLTTAVLHTTIATFQDATCEKIMETLEDTLTSIHDWAVDRIHTLCDIPTYDVVDTIEDAHAIKAEFSEWLDPKIEDHEIYSLEYLGDADD